MNDAPTDLGDDATGAVDPLADLDPELLAAAAEVDRILLRWFLGLSPIERLRAAQRASGTLRRFRRVEP